jgi:transcriptional regulator with XRE-family HTH domain
MTEWGSRLRSRRLRNDSTLAQLSAATGISVSTLSRLESGDRMPTLAHLEPLATFFRVTLDELVKEPAAIDPRVNAPVQKHGLRLYQALTRTSGDRNAYKITVPAEDCTPDPRVHAGHEWLYVLSGPVRLVIGDNDHTLQAGEAVEFSTTQPHWFGSLGSARVEILSIFSTAGEELHLHGEGPTTKDC